MHNTITITTRRALTALVAGLVVLCGAGLVAQADDREDLFNGPENVRGRGETRIPAIAWRKQAL